MPSAASRPSAAVKRLSSWEQACFATVVVMMPSSKPWKTRAAFRRASTASHFATLVLSRTAGYGHQPNANERNPPSGFRQLPNGSHPRRSGSMSASLARPFRAPFDFFRVRLGLRERSKRDGHVGTHHDSGGRSVRGDPVALCTRGGAVRDADAIVDAGFPILPRGRPLPRPCSSFDPRSVVSRASTPSRRTQPESSGEDCDTGFVWTSRHHDFERPGSREPLHFDTT